MHVLAKHLQKLNNEPAPHEEAMLESFKLAPGIDFSLLQRARSLGITWPMLVGLAVHFGQLFNSALSLTMDSLETKSLAAQEEEEDAAREAKKPPTRIPPAQPIKKQP